MNTATPSLRATPSKEGEFKTDTPPFGHAFILKRNENQLPKIPLQNEGVARSDGVAAFELQASRKLKQLPYNPALKQRAKELRKAGHLSEALFWNAVKNKQFNGLDFDRQRVIGNYIVDFYCHELVLVVEIDGSSHDDKQAYDQVRDEYLQALGMNVLHVQDTDIKTNLDGVLMSILL